MMCGSCDPWRGRAWQKHTCSSAIVWWAWAAAAEEAAWASASRTRCSAVSTRSIAMESCVSDSACSAAWTWLDACAAWLAELAACEAASEAAAEYAAAACAASAAARDARWASDAYARSEAAVRSAGESASSSEAFTAPAGASTAACAPTVDN